MSSFNNMMRQTIPELLNNSSYENDILKITFTYNKYMPSTNRKINDTLCTVLGVDIGLTNKINSSFVSTKLDLLYIPVMTVTGFQVGNSYRQILDLYDKAKGWYLLKGKNKNNSKYTTEDDIMSLLPSSGKHLTFTCKDGVIVVEDKQHKSVKLGHFLKAFTGKSYKELIDLLGINKYILNSLREDDELSVLDSVKETASLFVRYNRGMDDTTLAKTVQRSLLNSQYLSLNKVSRLRLASSISFTTRAEGAELVDSIMLNGKEIPAGTKLLRPILLEIDKSNIDTLRVKKDKVYELKKYSYEEDRLSINEILTMVNMYANLLDGYANYDEEYELTSRVLINYEQKVCDLIRQKVNIVIRDITNNLDSVAAKSDVNLLGVIKSISNFDKEDLINHIKNVEAKEMQLSDTSNPIAFESKNAKLTMNYSGKASKEMVSIQDTQRSLIDPIESPESSKVGKTGYKTVVSKIDENGLATAPYMRVKNGEVISDEPVYLTAAETQYEYIAEWNEKFETEEIQAFFNGVVVKVPKDKVTLINYSPYDDMAIARASIPFQNYSNAKRLLMGANYHRQADTIINPERAMVSTGSELFIKGLVYTAENILKETWDDGDYGTQFGVTEQEFVGSLLTLVGTRNQKGYRTYNFVASVRGRKIPIKKVLPFMQRTSKGSTFTYKLNVQKNNVYCGKDIVLYNGSVDIRKFDMELFADFGHMKVDPLEDLKYGLALGRNLNVGFKTFSSSTIEDAITIRQGLVYENKLTSILQKEITEECHNNEDYYEVFGFTDIENPPADYILQNGLPQVGTFLSAGSLVICKYRVWKNNNNPNASKLKSVKNHFLPNNISGEVISATIVDNVATVMIATISPIEVGDKMAGRYGNKGVVGRIVPDKDMPYDAETGKPLDVCLNPNGIPSRMNISQVLEVGLSQALNIEGKICVATPFKDNTMEYIKKKMGEAELNGRQLIDGRTGKPFYRKTFVGYMYMFKLEHMVNKKINSIGYTNSVNPLTNQPKKGASKGGGQAFSEYEMWCLIASNAKKVLNSLYTVQSDDIEAQRNIKDLIRSNPNDVELECTNNNDKMLQVVLRSFGVELEVVNNKYVYSTMTDKKIKSLAPNGLDPSNIDSLYHESKLLKGKNKINARDKWNWVDLGCEIIHPNWLIKAKLNRLIAVTVIKTDSTALDILNQRAFSDILEGRKALNFQHNPPSVISLESLDSDIDSDLIISGMPALVKLFRETDLENALRVYDKRISKAKELENETHIKKNYFEDLNQRNIILEWIENGQALSDYIISAFPIVPLVYRPLTDDVRRKHDFNQHYERIFAAIKEVKVTNNNNSILKVYNRIAEFIGLKDTDGSNSLQSLQQIYVGKDASGKGMLRSSMLKKRVHMSGRSVIIPTQDVNLKINEVGVPILLAVNIWNEILVSHLLRKSPLTDSPLILINNKQGANILDEDLVKELINCVASDNVMRFCEYLNLGSMQEDARNLYFNTKKFIIKVLEDQVVLFGRQPSLQKSSCKAFKVVITFNKAIELNPLVCKGYNADFDGDQMYLIGDPVTDAAEEAFNLMSADQMVINPKDSSNLLEHSQDMVLGVYFATMLHDNVASIYQHKAYDTIHVVQDLDELQLAIDVHSIHPHDLVAITIEGRRYLSTAGRILFNSLLPNGFTTEPFTNNLKLPVIGENREFAEGETVVPAINPTRYHNLLMDGIVSKKGVNKDGMVYFGLSDYTKNLYHEKPLDECIEVYQEIMKFGFKYCDISSITISLGDLSLDIDTKVYIDKAKAEADKVNQAYYDGLVSEAGKKAMVIDIYNELTKFLRDKVVIKALPRNNNLAIMLDSGSRGDIGQIMQTVGIVGISMKTGSESLETPILNSYSSGLTSFEVFLASYGARMGVDSTQNETADAGYATRKSVFMIGGIKIVDDDCGNKEDTLILPYDNLWKIVTPKNEEISVDSSDNESGYVNSLSEYLEGKILSPHDTECNKLLLNFLPADRTLTEECLRQIIKHKVRKVICVTEKQNNDSTVTQDETYTLKYKLTNTIKDLLLYRYLTEDTLHLKAGTYLKEMDIDAIEKANLETLHVRTMMTCKSVGGVCAKCYGLKFDTQKLPMINEYVGIEAAQAIGESGAQLSMSLFHAGGITGGASSGIKYMSKRLKGSVPSKEEKAVIANKEGYIYYKTLGKQVYISNHPSTDVVDMDRVIVKSGEYVEVGEPLSSGMISFGDIGGRRPTLKMIRKRQLLVLDDYKKTYAASNLNVHARHFEMVVRVQTALVQIYESDDKDIKVGTKRELAEVLDSIEKGHNIVYDHTINTEREVIEHFSGGLSLLAFERLDENLARLNMSNPNKEENSIMGRLLVGENIIDNFDENGNLLPSERKRLVHGQFEYHDVDRNETKVVADEDDIELSYVPNSGNGASINLDIENENYDFGQQSFEIDFGDIDLEDLTEGESIKGTMDSGIDEMSVF